MPNIKSAKKRVKVSERQHNENVAVKSYIKNTVKKYNEMMAKARDIATTRMIEQAEGMGADAIVPITAYGTPASSGFQGVYSPDDIEQIHRTGYINIFRGAPIVQIPQSFIDENNVKTYVDPQLAYILPTGGEKVVKVVLEGATQMHDFQNRDNSLEVYAYKKMGCAILTHYNWCIYQNTGIPQTYEQPYGY